MVFLCIRFIGGLDFLPYISSAQKPDIRGVVNKKVLEKGYLLATIEYMYIGTLQKMQLPINCAMVGMGDGVYDGLDLLKIKKSKYNATYIREQTYKNSLKTS